MAVTDLTHTPAKALALNNLGERSKSSLCIVVSTGTGGVLDFAQEYSRNLHNAQVIVLEPTSNFKQFIGAHVFLQYSGYGFQKRGTPLWLVNYMRELRKHAKSIGIFFHELYAFGPPWRSAFWLSPWQRDIVVQLAEVSDYWMTNRWQSADWIRLRSTPKPFRVVPVFSNIGEEGLVERTQATDILVFGSAAVRERVYKGRLQSLLNWAKDRNAIIHDVGPPISSQRLHHALVEGQVKLHGRLDVASIQRIMRAAHLGLMSYSNDELAKSGVFAAYCANGLPAVVLDGGNKQADGVSANKHFFTQLPSNDVPLSKFKDTAQNAWAWYESHSKNSHISAFNHLVSELPNGRE